MTNILSEEFHKATEGKTDVIELLVCTILAPSLIC